jgi:DNA-directed RNA polymerase subunit RPC12/RpoP
MTTMPVFECSECSHVFQEWYKDPELAMCKDCGKYWGGDDEI